MMLQDPKLQDLNAEEAWPFVRDSIVEVLRGASEALLEDGILLSAAAAPSGALRLEISSQGVLRGFSVLSLGEDNRLQIQFSEQPSTAIADQDIAEYREVCRVRDCHSAILLGLAETYSAGADAMAEAE